MKEYEEMKRPIDEMRKQYESVDIPPELSRLVKNTIKEASRELDQSGDFNQKPENRNSRGHRRKRSSHPFLLRTITSAVAVFAVLIGVFAYGVNTNEAFADSVKDVPILGALASVFTGSVIRQSDDVADVEAFIPEVKGLKDKKLQDMINQKVTEKTTAAINETKKEMKEAKKAWLDKGGKEEDYMQHEIDVNYDIKCITEDTLSFAVMKTQTQASSYSDIDYYNYDLNTGKELTLGEVLKKKLGKNSMQKATDIIKKDIADRSTQEGAFYFDGSEGVEGFTSLSKKQSFYINQAGNPVIVFNKYEIAPGYMGIQEFEIK